MSGIMGGGIKQVWTQETPTMRAYCDAMERNCKTLEDWMVCWATHRVEFAESVSVMAYHPFPARNAL